jgi:hypothetical protein
VNQVDGPMLRVQITSGSPICGRGIPTQLVLGYRWYAPLLARSVNTQLRYAEVLDVTGRLTALLLGRLLGVLLSLRLARWGVLFNGAR